ncbi:glucan biosynthesis protein [Marinobacter goseongensis]|uniref:glucan biosynthesis protein n=1 Tax=Marinobacter goseongensis TaxID=453838 RepID=UPI003D07E807
MDRRTLLKLGLLLGCALPLARMPLTQAATGTAPDNAGQPFSHDWLRQHARALAAKPYQSRQAGLPAALNNLSWDDYQSIRFRPDHALWRGNGSPFRAQFFHLGLYFRKPVQFFEVRDGVAQPIPYRADHFEHGDGIRTDDLPEDLGYAGFRIHGHQDFRRDLVAFLGASYFRAVGESRQYGLSARGLAIDTGLPREEEFPDFTAFWLETPAAGATDVVVHALLDSPSITGAYRLRLRPGKNMVMDISASLYPRQAIERIGIAPLTSMYQTGENDRRKANDWRPEIHDSDGLALWTGAGERLWRPLVNPRTLRVSHFRDDNPRGFGLMQRDREFSHYQDDGVFYERRPSLWVEPRQGWGSGDVVLVEIPTDDETFDNIVAFWHPHQPLKPGNEHRLDYRLTWGEHHPHPAPELATTRATRTGIGGVVGQPRRYFSRRFAVDFSGGQLAMLANNTNVEAIVSASRGRVELVSARPLHALNGYRAMFDLVPDDTAEPVELRLFLRLGAQALTETWLYQYSPPPLTERTF